MARRQHVPQDKKPNIVFIFIDNQLLSLCALAKMGHKQASVLREQKNC